MYTRLLAILLDIGIIFAAGVWLTWIGVVPVRIGPKRIAVPADPGLKWFRIFARVVGPIIILATSWQMVHDVRRMVRPAALVWQSYTSPEGRFRVDLPGEPEQSSSDITMFGTPVTEYKYKTETSEREVTFVVSYVDGPEAVGKAEPRAFLDSELESRVATSHVRLLKKSPATVDGCPAIYFSMDATEQGIQVEGYLILDHFRVYQLGAQYLDERTEADRKRFLESFRIVRAAS